MLVCRLARNPMAGIRVNPKFPLLLRELQRFRCPTVGIFLWASEAPVSKRVYLKLDPLHDRLRTEPALRSAGEFGGSGAKAN